MTRRGQAKFWLIGLVAMVAALYLLRGILLPFVVGMAIAYLLDPLADRLERVGLSRTLATLVIIGGFFGLATTVVMLLLPVLQDQVAGFVQRVPGYVEGLSARVQPMIERIQQHLSPKDIERLQGAAGGYAGTIFGWAAEVVKGVLTGGLAVVNVLSLIFIMPVVAFYLLRDWDNMTARIDGWLPREHRAVVREQLARIDTTLAGFVRGQAMVCLVLAIFYGAGLTSVGLDVGLIVGLVTGLLSFIPYLGNISGFFVSMGLALAQSNGWALPASVAVLFAVGNLLEGNFLTPKLVGNRVGLHPVWIIFSLFAGGALFGFVGVLLAVPSAAVIGVLIRFAMDNYLHSSLYAGEAPDTGDGQDDGA